MNQYQYDNMTPDCYEVDIQGCEYCKESYVLGYNDSWIELEDIIVSFCSNECKECWKKGCDEDEINEIICEGM